MELILAAATVALLFILAFFKPGFGLAMALCIPLIDQAIGPQADFLGLVSPGVILSMALLRLILGKKGEDAQNRLCFVDVTILLWIAYLPFSVLMAESANMGIFVSLRLIYMSFSFYVTTRILAYTTGTNELIRSFINGMIVFGLFISIVALIRMESASEYVMRLTIGDGVIPLSILIMLGIVHALFVLTFLNKTSSLGEKLFALLSLPVMVYAVILCNTRSVILGLVLVLLYFLFRVLTSKRVDQGIGVKVFFGVFAFVGASVFFAAANPETWARMGSRFLSLSEGGLAESEEGRVSLIQVAVDLFTNSPLVGAGVGNFEFHYNAYPHNMFLEVLADMGLIGCLLLVVIVFGAGFLAMKYQSMSSIYVGAVVLFMLFESVISMSVWMHKNLFVFVGLAAANHLYQMGAKRSRRRKKILRRTFSKAAGGSRATA